MAAAAALVSHRHLSGLLGHCSEDAVTVAVGPLTVDGLMLMATGALLATGCPTATDAASATATNIRADGHASETALPQAAATVDTTQAGDGRTTSATATAARRHHVRPTSLRPRQSDAANDLPFAADGSFPRCGVGLRAPSRAGPIRLLHQLQSTR
ncbi:hypothetical protein [Micromonospora sp. CB01531]|uniref:hypothetical protein n=1 Tax=Micromonospora sp. CB01531 TaxID=1718947 RepID=UPI000938CBEC|nr:hypothetical protein [Micromonospora sp. CB01531]OKI67810.1 hypothetical protein A6A27_21800 [Micromonospora sp. CB01531]